MRLNKNFWLIFLGLLLAVVFLLWQQQYLNKVSTSDIKINNTNQLVVDTPAQTPITLKDQTFFLEIADTPAKQRQGLSGRDSLSSDHGMLFIFPEEKIMTFWMKDMKFNIDLLWISGQKIVAWEKNMLAPVANVPDGQLLQYTSPFPADKVLELPSGTIDRLSLHLGDTIDLSQLAPLE